MDLHLASYWEAVADTVGSATALSHGATTITWADYDDRASRLATALAQLDVAPTGKVALCLPNRPEHLIAQLAAFKLRAVAVNVSYRYLDDELAHLLAVSDSEAVICEPSSIGRILRLRDRVPLLRHVIAVDAPSDRPASVHSFDELIAAHAPMPRIERCYDDLYLLFTGGTTGRPKGVMYRHGERAHRFAQAGLAPLGIDPPRDVDAVPGILAEVDRLTARPTTLVCCPLMHGTGMWLGAFVTAALGGTLVTLTGRSLDPDEAWTTVARAGVTHIVLVGDAVAQPLLRSLDAAAERGAPHDITSLRSISSSGATWSEPVRQGFLRHGDVELVDRLGSSEGALVGVRRTRRGVAAATSSFEPTPGTKLLTVDGRELPPGSGQVGVLAAPATAIGYYNDPAASAATFPVIDGMRYVLSGDWATMAEDGTIAFVGRGSQTINTGGEKVFPEEVEDVLRAHPLVEDCIVVGTPDERFGETVVAVTSLQANQLVAEAELIDWVRARLAPYKAPRDIAFVDAVRRTESAKPDYPWAQRTAAAALRQRRRGRDG